MDFFYFQPEKIKADTLTIDGEEFSHLVHVMRKKQGDELMAVDGKGNAYDVTIETIRQRAAVCRIIKKYVGYNETHLGITIAAGVLKNPSKFDYLVEKVTELGAIEIIPLRTERTIPAHAKSERWRKLALAAMKQSGRSRLPVVRRLTAIEEILEEDSKFDGKFIAHEQPVAGCPAIPSAQGMKNVLILIGPEGGFSDEELERCRNKGFEPLYLGERRLRTETAAIVGMAVILYSART